MDFYDLPPSFPDFERKLRAIKAEYPFLRLFPIGKSVLGRKLYAAGIGNLRCCNLFVGAVHGQEWLTTTVLVRFLEELCQSVQARTRFAEIPFYNTLLEKGVVFIPMLNPDGVEIALGGAESAGHLHRRVREMMASSPRSWQANARGIDLNHNFDAGFAACQQAERDAGILVPGPRQYGGKCAHSEPETKALVRFCQSFWASCAFAFHSQGEEIFYEYGENTPAVSKYIATLLSSYCGYELVHQNGLASHGGFKDWFIDKLHRPAFTIEIGRGENPLPITDFPEVYARLRECLAIMTGI